MKKKLTNKLLLQEIEFIDPVLSVEEFKQIILRDTDEKMIDATSLFHEKIKNIPTFALGRYMWYVVDKLSLVKSGGMVDYFVGQSANEWKNKSPEEYFEIVFREDAPYVMGYAKLIYEFLVAIPHENKDLIRPYICFRLQTPGSLEPRWVLFYYIDWLYGSDGRIAGILHAIYDISHIKTDGSPMMTILDLREETNQLYFSHAPANVTMPLQRMSVCRISEREREILRLLTQGFSSKQIADRLQIAKNTVENHRQNLLKKTNCNSSTEMVSYAIQHGLM